MTPNEEAHHSGQQEYPMTLWETYKDWQSFQNGKGVCYRAENGGSYTRADFLALVYGDAHMAEVLFDLCNWQLPETLLDEELSDRCMFGEFTPAVSQQRREEGQRRLRELMNTTGPAEVRAKAFLQWVQKQWPFPGEGAACERALAFYAHWLERGPDVLFDCANVLIWGLAMVRPDLVDTD